jgi:4-hydroxy-tetrahydrodipicolinate synthase
MRRPWTGCGTALVTPFSRDGAVDEAAVRRLARRQIEAGIHFLVPVGTTGESPTLSEDERVRVVELVAEEAAGQVPVLAGAGGYDTREVIHVGRRMGGAGATGLLSVTPYYNKPTPEGLFQHYSAIAGEVGLPIVVYNVPGRTGCNVDVATLVRLSGVPGIVAVKEASGNITQMVEICGAVPKDFLVLSGDDALTLPLMAVGGHGLISVAGNEVPGEMARMVEHAEQGDFAGARQIHNQLLPLMLVNFIESNPIPVKAAMAAMGLIEEVYRLPLVAPGAVSREKIMRVHRYRLVFMLESAGSMEYLLADMLSNNRQSHRLPRNQRHVPAFDWNVQVSKSLMSYFFKIFYGPARNLEVQFPSQKVPVRINYINCVMLYLRSMSSVRRSSN